MAVRFDTVGERLVRTSGVLDYNAPYTVMGWFWLDEISGYHMLFSLNQDEYDVDCDMVYVSPLGYLRVYCDVFAGNVWVQGAQLASNTWYHIAMVRESSTACKLYLNGVLQGTSTRDISPRNPATRFECGGQTTAEDPDQLLGAAAYLKAWEAALTLGEIQQEMYCITPVRTGDLYGFWPVFPGVGERARDYSGVGHSWTETGTLADASAPPVSWGGVLPYTVGLPQPVEPAEARTAVSNPSVSIGGPVSASPVPASAAGSTAAAGALLGPASIAPAASSARARREGPNSDTTTLVQPGPCAARAGRAGPELLHSSATVEPAPCLAKAGVVDPACIVAFLVRPDPCTAVAGVLAPDLFFSSCSFVPAVSLAACDAPALVYRVLNVTVIAMTLCARPQDLTLGERRGVHLVERWDLEDGTGHWLFEDGSGIVLGMGVAGTKLNLWARSLELSLEGKD